MEFDTKRELLEYLGKNPTDNKLVDRMMARGEVVKRDGVFYLVVEDEVSRLRRKVKELESVSGDVVARGLYEDEQRENGELREKVLKLEAENKSLKNNEWGDLIEKLKDAEVNVKYYKDLYEKESENNKEIIKNMYRYITWTLHIKVKWEDFRNYALGYEGQ